jgi:hypothetical protein
MQLKNGRVFFDAAEQQRFNVDPDVSVESARRTAVVFNEVAGTLDDHATDMDDEPTGEALNRRLALADRAAQLSVFAVKIEHTCADVIDAEFLAAAGIEA